MIKIENSEVMGWEAAIRGMRNPMNSWKKSDSGPTVDCGKCGKLDREGWCNAEDRNCADFECFYAGLNDLTLMKKLRNAGTDHRKFMRMITVYVDITAPLYFYKEFDTYKVGTVANSCSTMHKIHAKGFNIDDFSHDHLFDEDSSNAEICSFEVLRVTIKALNAAREWYLKTSDKRYWWQMIQLLPSSYNQKRTVMLNYEVLANMYKSRKNHKLDEWRELCKWIETLPYSELITGVQDNVTEAGE